MDTFRPPYSFAPEDNQLENPMAHLYEYKRLNRVSIRAPSKAYHKGYYEDSSTGVVKKLRIIQVSKKSLR